jgi:hypothetical protein
MSAEEAVNASPQATVFHISEDPGIERFEPRPSEFTDEPVIWAVDDERLRNYLLPRDCPRVTGYAGRDTTAADRERFLGNHKAIVAIEDRWLDRARFGCVCCYHLPADTFECHDEGAGYFVSRVAVRPVHVELRRNLLDELRRRGVQLRVLENLWPFRDAVVASTLQFSMIRMRNARPRG